MAKSTRTRGKKRASAVHKRKTTLIIIAVAIVVLIGAVTLPFVTTTAKKNATIYIPSKGATTQALTDSLAKNTDKKFASRVITLLKISGVKDVVHRHGAFKIAKGASALKVAYLIRRGEPSEVKFTFNNVRTLDEFATRAGSKFEASKSDFMKALTDPDVCDKCGGHTPENIGCILLADSYKFYWDISPEKLLKNMYNYYQQFWNDERTEKAKALGLTPDEVVILASITEEETSKSDERGKVGRLYINRLHKNMRLQADPTVKFALGDFSIKRITKSMCAFQSPYNTYRVAGLPPGPIRLPEKQTIDAILNSEPHNYLYMCAKSDFSGYHDFATDLAAHNANAQRYQAELNKRNIK